MAKIKIDDIPLDDGDQDFLGLLRKLDKSKTPSPATSIPPARAERIAAAKRKKKSGANSKGSSANDQKSE